MGIIISNLLMMQVTCVILFSLGGKYHYNRLPIGGVISFPKQFQQKMNDLLHLFEFFCTYIDYHLILARVYWTDYVQILELTPNKFK